MSCHQKHLVLLFGIVSPRGTSLLSFRTQSTPDRKLSPVAVSPPSVQRPSFAPLPSLPTISARWFAKCAALGAIWLSRHTIASGELVGGPESLLTMSPRLTSHHPSCNKRAKTGGGFDPAAGHAWKYCWRVTNVQQAIILAIHVQSKIGSIGVYKNTISVCHLHS